MNVQATPFCTNPAKRNSAGNRINGIVRSPMRADRIKINQIRSGFFSPVLGPLVRNRQAIVLLAAVAVVQVALTAAGTIAWQCPVKSTLDVACPACGLTRATVLFAQGHWKDAIELHAFAPIFFGGGIFLVIGCILLVCVVLWMVLSLAMQIAQLFQLFQFYEYIIQYFLDIQNLSLF